MWWSNLQFLHGTATNGDIFIQTLVSSNLLDQSSNVAVVLCRVHSHSILLLQSLCIHTHSIRTDLDIMIMWVLDQIKYVRVMSYIYASIHYCSTTLKSWCIHTHSIRTDLDIIIMWVLDQIKYIYAAIHYCSTTL